jgi:hypothetical protein
MICSCTRCRLTALSALADETRAGSLNIRSFVATPTKLGHPPAELNLEPDGTWGKVNADRMLRWHHRLDGYLRRTSRPDVALTFP